MDLDHIEQGAFGLDWSDTLEAARRRSPTARWDGHPDVDEPGVYDKVLYLPERIEQAGVIGMVFASFKGKGKLVGIDVRFPGTKPAVKKVGAMTPAERRVLVEEVARRFGWDGTPARRGDRYFNPQWKLGKRSVALLADDLCVDDYQAVAGGSPGHIVPVVSLTLAPR